MKTYRRLAVYTAISLIACSLASAEIPQLISYQGKVTEGSQPVADGSYTMRFRIYNDPSSGTLRWDSGNQAVQVTNGVFSILLGESGQPALVLSFDEDLWILVTFEGVNQIPRQRMVSVGYAYMASGIVPGTDIVGAITTGTNAVLKGENTATTGALYGIIGKISSEYGAGVFGISSNSGADLSYGVKGSYNADGDGAGVHGEATTTSPGESPSGVSGIAWAASGTAYGGSFTSQSTSGRGVYGTATASSGTTYGVYGLSASWQGYGVYGEATATSGIACGGRFRSSSTEGLGVYGEATATSGIAYGGQFESSSTIGRGVYGLVSATSGYTHGVYGESESTDGRGVNGWASATSGETYGVYGKSSSTEGLGVYGLATAISGTTYGGRFRSDSNTGRGVYGEAMATSGETYGVYGESASSTGYGVYGEIVSTQTGTAYGVYGKTNATEGATYGVYGTINSAYGAGVCGVSSNSGSTLSYGVKGSYNADGAGAGVHGEATTTSPGESPSGVSGIAWATSGTAYGGLFESQSTSGHGVYGKAVASSGSAWGVYGLGNSTAGGGVYGIAEPNNIADAVGVLGRCEPADYYGIGVAAEGTYRAFLALCSTSGSNGGSYYGGYLRGEVSGSTGTVYGVYGYASGGSQHYGVYYSGGINGSGVMRNTIRTDDGPVSMYVQQATENWFEDFGTGVIRNGKTRVALREDYRKTITANEDHPVKVFVTPTARLGEWWVEKSSHGFVIHAPEAPDGATFDYRIVGKRKNAENLRLESMPSGYTDEGLYPDDAAVPAEYLRERQKSKRAQEMELE
jgi:hypothetical protein